MQKKIMVFIGLGNVPQEYTYTRHNIGKDFLLYFYNNFLQTKSLYLYYKDSINNDDCYFVVPNTYMNISGNIFQDMYLKNLYLNNNVITIIIHDDLEIDFGKYKFRSNTDRGERGHNGNRSIIKALKEIQKNKYTKPYFLSIGIGRPKDDSVDKWVLKKFSDQDIYTLEKEIYPNIKKELKNIINFF